MILETLFDIFSKIIRNMVYFFEFCLKIPPSQGAAAPWGAAEGGAGGMFFQIILKKHSIFQKSLKIGKAIFSNSRKCSFFKISIIMGRRKMPYNRIILGNKVQDTRPIEADYQCPPHLGAGIAIQWGGACIYIYT